MKMSTQPDHDGQGNFLFGVELSRDELIEMTMDEEIGPVLKEAQAEESPEARMEGVLYAIWMLVGKRREARLTRDVQFADLVGLDGSKLVN